jgi:serine protease
MHRSLRAGLLAGLLVAAAGVEAGAAPAEYNGEFPRRQQADLPVARLIIGLRGETGAARAAAPVGERMQALSVRSRLVFRSARALGPAMQVVELDRPVVGDELGETLARIASDPAVAFVEPDGRAYRHAVASDPLFPGQWYLQDVEASALNAVAAWDEAPGSAGIVVAVLDTGVRFDHPDLLQAGRGGRLLPGYDFVGPGDAGGFSVANDGDGWDPNPSDPGDWVSSAQAQTATFAGCAVTPSSWHGTRVAGMIGAITNNGTGIAGTTWGTWILPVRVLGKCYGNNSDILQGMRWAAGLPVPGVPANPYPARVINMSLGAAGACTAGYQSVLAELAEIGVLVVASAGNSTGGPVEFPANCPGVAAVTGLRHVGTKVGFSSVGPEVTIGAPGGNCVNTAPGAPCLYSLDTTSDSGATRAVTSLYTDQFNYNVGTSFAAPSVAGIAALMLSVNGNLDAPALITRLREAARPFPPPPPGVAQCYVPVSQNDFQLECACTTSTCGAGMADAAASVAAARRPVAAIAVPASVAAGQDVVLDAGGSSASCGRSVAAFAWSVVSGSATIVGADQAVATVVAPPSGSFRLRVTVTDDQGAVDAADVLVSATSATTTAPAAAGASACPAAVVPADPGDYVDDGPVAQAQSSGGGGGVGLVTLGVLAFASLFRATPGSRRRP